MAGGMDCKTQERTNMQQTRFVHFSACFVFLGFAIHPFGHCLAFRVEFFFVFWPFCSWLGRSETLRTLVAVAREQVHFQTSLTLRLQVLVEAR